MEQEFDDDLTFTPFEAAPSRLTIDLGALAENWRMLKKASGKARTGAAVKGDGYGLGIEAVVPALYDAGCRDMFVATPDEGMLRGSLRRKRASSSFPASGRASRRSSSAMISFPFSSPKSRSPAGPMPLPLMKSTPAR